MAKDNVQSANAFVKAEQSKLKSMMGDRPAQKAEAYKFNANMSNDGDHAKSFASSLTSGLDKKAFPVR